ncbi:MAG: Nif3-like dinuclear metal center hexameric protein [Clostridiales Family XIII bacterium]|jgi:dinuclear metal center YbgI/SA1388 family protein|nr:Nif3-like dinuclear metal center hexameric protein [Clostridiales Family XIII bacterium]
MSIDRKKLIQQIEKISPPERALDWDNNGMQINVGGDAEIKRVLVTLDITEEIIREAREMNADFILAHHPLLFHKIQKIDCGNVVGRQIIELICAGISVYAAHTSFDVAYGGNNDYLCELLDLQKIRRVPPEGAASGEIMGKIGNLKREMCLAEVCDLLRERLHIDRRLPVVGDPAARILKVGLCTGGGGEQMEAFAASGCSLYITGDVRHHEALLAAEKGICLIDAGHFDTEWIFVQNFAERLKTAVGDVAEVYMSRRGKGPFAYL